MARVLIVDDDPDILGFVQRRVKSAGHNVIAVGSAEEALSVITTKGPPDVAVLDVGLPGLNGLQLLRALREQEPMARLPVIFLTRASSRRTSRPAERWARPISRSLSLRRSCSPRSTTSCSTPSPTIGEG